MTRCKAKFTNPVHYILFFMWQTKLPPMSVSSLYLHNVLLLNLFSSWISDTAHLTLIKEYLKLLKLYDIPRFGEAYA